MNELRIYFADLIAFVPVADGSYWVLLPDAQKSTLASDGVTPIDPHYPVALFDLPNQGHSEWQQIHTLLQLTPPPGDHEAWILKRQELRFSIPSNLPVQATGAAPTGLPQSGNRTDFSWAPDLAALGIPGTVDPACLVPVGPAAPGPPSPKIVSRLQLQSGQLATFQFVKRSLTTFPYSLRLPLLEFGPLGGGPIAGGARACADIVVAVLPFNGPTIDVSAFDLDSGSLVRQISLTAGSSSGVNAVNLLIGNLSPDPPATFSPPSFGLHFERYYDLLTSPPSTRPIPFLVSGFPLDPTTHISPKGIDGINPAFIQSALEVPFSGFNGQICSLVTMRS